MNDNLHYRPIIITSGSFTCNFPTLPIAMQATNLESVYPPPQFTVERVPEIANPMASREIKFEIVDYIASRSAHSFLSEAGVKRLLNQGHIPSYADTLLSIGKAFAVNPPDTVIVPLRGGLKPSIQLNVLGKQQMPHLWLPFTQGSQKMHLREIRSYLIEGLRIYRGKELLRLAVVDAAISGHSALALAAILQSVHAEIKPQRWEVRFHLLYSRENPNHPFPKEASDIPVLSNDHITMAVTPYLVDGLLIEDWNEALGVEITWEGQTYIIKQASEGRIIIRMPNGDLKIIESRELNHFIDVMISEGVNNSIFQDPSLRLKPNI